MSVWLYYSAVLLLLVSNVVGFAMNLAALPGNWWIVAGTALFCWFSRNNEHYVSWYVFGILVGLAIIGELLEFAAGTAGAAKSGASRRAMALSVVGGIVGSIVGAVIGVPIPVIGSAIAAMLGGAGPPLAKTGKVVICRVRFRWDRARSGVAFLAQRER